MNGTELFKKAEKAAYTYKSVYGTFPDKIGIHHRQLELLPLYIRFPLLPQVNICSKTEMEDIGSYMIEVHETKFEPVIGHDIHMDEVYFQMPGTRSNRTMSSELVAKMAKEFE